MSTQRLVPQYPDGVSPDNLKEAVFQALGTASVCWAPSPTGLFMSERCEQVGNELLEVIYKFVASQAITKIEGKQ